MKLLSLIRAQFSRGFLREILLGVEVAVMLCLMAPVMSDVAALLSIDRLASQLTSPALFFQAADRYLVPDNMEEAAYHEMLNRVDGLAGVEDVGRMAVGTTSLDGVGTAIRFYNDALLARVKLPLRRSAEVMPGEGKVGVIVNEAMAARYPVGTVVPADVYFGIARVHQQMELVVVGVMDSDGYYYAFRGGGSEVMLNALGAKNDGTEYNLVALSGFDQVPTLDVSASCLLFVGQESESVCNAINAAASGDGVAVTIAELRQNSLKYVVQQQPMVFLAALLMVGLCVTGIITYVWLTVQDFLGRFSLYFICGMTRARGMVVLLGVHLLPMLLGTGVALVALRVLKLQVTGAGVRLALLVLLPLMVFCLLVAALRFRTVDPILQLRRGE